MAKKTKVATYRNKADRLWSIAVRSDWNGRCAVCGGCRVEAHHLIPRQHEATRYDLHNGVALCSRCHQFDPDISPHQNAAGWTSWLRANQPRVWNWLSSMVASGEHKSFDGTKNAAYYCNVIRDLRQYVTDEEFRAIVGQRFADWLETRE